MHWHMGAEIREAVRTGSVGFLDGERDAAEWEYAWQHFGDKELCDEASGEVLQYMGSFQEQHGRWYHTFRHRCHPQTRQREYWHIPARLFWQPQDEGD